MVKVYGVDTEEFEHATKDEIWAYFKQKEFIQFDCETLGFDVHTKPLMCVQMGDFENQFVIHPDKLQEFKIPLERRTLIGHNIKFDLKFLYKNDIWPNKVYDTFLAESIIYCGLNKVRKGLNHVAKRRLNIDLDKSVRDNIWNEGLTRRVIEYSADDVKYLEKIKDAQKKDLDKWELHKALELDNEFVLCLAYIEYCGFRLHKEKWQKKSIKDKETLKERELLLSKFVIDNNLNKYIRQQLDLFSTERECVINWGSPKQVVELFEDLKIPVLVKKKGKMVKSVESKAVEKYEEKFPIIKPYLSYKEAAKVVSTYGDSFIKQINPVTGRIHTNFRQILNTGRLSSGGKNKGTKEEYINLQNIPSDEETRSCFIANKGNKLIISDYTAQEDFVFVELSKEKKLIEFYNDTTKKRDGHSFVAKMCFPKELKDVPEEEVKKVRGDLRDAAKKAKFAIHYGGNGQTIADNINIPVEEGNMIYEAYMEAFPGIKAYFEKCKKAGLKNGYIKFNDITNRISFIEGFEDYKQLQNEINRDFWNKWRDVKLAYEKGLRIEEYTHMKDKISHFFKIKGNIEKASLNYPVQGTAAEVTKLAAVYFFDWIKKNKYQNIVLIPNDVHDELDAEAPDRLTKEVATNLQECMERAGEVYCKVVKLKAVPTIATDWSQK
jgi:DNA polymerase I-like protein with 3'-5' exonuclease and polymerase domains